MHVTFYPNYNHTQSNFSHRPFLYLDILPSVKCVGSCYSFFLLNSDNSWAVGLKGAVGVGQRG